MVYTHMIKSLTIKEAKSPIHFLGVRRDIDMLYC